jgi:Carboxypeptidase regulatory-like domain
MQSLRKLATSLVVLLSAFGTFGWAQSTTSLHGTISDTKGAVVSGATVTISNAATGFSRTTQSDDQGVYQFLQLPPASYSVSVSASGFATVKEEHVPLLVNTPATLNLTVPVQGSAVTVEVTAVAPTVNTTDATLGNAFNSQQILALPSEGRDPVGILSSQPGVTYIGSSVDQTNDSRGGTVSGARSDQTNVTYDGLDNNDQVDGFAFQGAMRATLDSLQEFRVTTSNANADAGRSSGAQVSLVTKSGTNNFHGSLYEYHRPNYTTANDYFNKQAQLRSGEPNQAGFLLRNTFGVSVGGPIKKNRAFFFANYEGQRTRSTDQVLRTIPSDNLRQGIVQYPCNTADDSNCVAGTPNPNGFQVTSDPRLDPDQLLVTLTPAQFAATDPNCTGNGTCPQGPGANPNVLAIFNQYPHPNSDATGDLFDLRGFTFAGAHPEKLNTYIVKLDFKLDSAGKHNLFLRGNLQNDNESTPPLFLAQPAQDFKTNNSKGIAVGYTALLRDNLINNLRYQFVRQGIGGSGLTTSDVALFRGVDEPIGETRSTFATVPVHNLVDDLSWVKGKHTIQVGTNWRFITNNRASNAQNFSQAVTNVYWLDNAGIAGTGSSLDPGAFAGYPAVDPAFGTNYDFAVAAVAGLLTEADVNFNQDKTGALLPPGDLIRRHFRSFEAEWYVQDAWRAKPNLTLTFGLRHSLLQPPYETGGNQAAPDFSLHDWFNERGADMQRGIVPNSPPISMVISGQANGGKPYWDWDYKDFAPRLAFAYSPNFDSGFMHALFGSNGKSSIRGGYGLYYDHFGQGVVSTFDQQGSFGLSTTITNGAGVQDVDCTARYTALFTLPSGTFCGQNFNPAAPGPFPVTPPTGFDDGSFAIYWGLDNKLKTPYSHVFDFSITRELPNGFVVEASYVGRLGHRLLQEVDLAMPLNLVDPQSKTSYFQAATKLAKLADNGTPVANVAPIPYWENMFPSAAGPTGAQLWGCNSLDESGLGANITATQAMYDMFGCFRGNETTALFIADLFCFPACAAANGENPFAYWDDQFSSLYAWRSQGTSSYHALQLSLRRALTRGLQFDINYTFSKSLDEGSNAERVSLFNTGANGTGGFGDQIINSWFPQQQRAVSDFDMRHQINANWLLELPVGRGKRFAGSMNRVANAILGGWELSGLYHWTTGLPFGVVPGAGWATNWELQGFAVKTGDVGSTGRFTDSNGDPNIFKDPQKAINAFRFPYPGETGQRNVLRGQGYFDVDMGLGKSWNVAEGQSLQFRWETFNVTNSVRFDAALSAQYFDTTGSTNFGKYGFTLTTPRRMQFALRYTF